jgi:hypothetical protein
MPSSRAEQSMPEDSTPRTLLSLDLQTTGSAAPGRAHGTLLPGSDVWRTADDLQHLAATDIHPADAQPISVRMTVHAERPERRRPV